MLKILHTYISSQKWDSLRILNVFQYDKNLKEINHMEDAKIIDFFLQCQKNYKQII